MPSCSNSRFEGDRQRPLRGDCEIVEEKIDMDLCIYVILRQNNIFTVPYKP